MGARWSSRGGDDDPGREDDFGVPFQRGCCLASINRCIPRMRASKPCCPRRWPVGIDVVFDRVRSRMFSIVFTTSLVYFYFTLAVYQSFGLLDNILALLIYTIIFLIYAAFFEFANNPFATKWWNLISFGGMIAFHIQTDASMKAITQFDIYNNPNFTNRWLFAINLTIMLGICIALDATFLYSAFFIKRKSEFFKSRMTGFYSVVREQLLRRQPKQLNSVPMTDVPIVAGAAPAVEAKRSAPAAAEDASSQAPPAAGRARQPTLVEQSRTRLARRQLAVASAKLPARCYCGHVLSGSSESKGDSKADSSAAAAMVRRESEPPPPPPDEESTGSASSGSSSAAPASSGPGSTLAAIAHLSSAHGLNDGAFASFPLPVLLSAELGTLIAQEASGGGVAFAAGTRAAGRSVAQPKLSRKSAKDPSMVAPPVDLLKERMNESDRRVFVGTWPNKDPKELKSWYHRFCCRCFSRYFDHKLGRDKLFDTPVFLPSLIITSTVITCMLLLLLYGTSIDGTPRQQARLKYAGDQLYTAARVMDSYITSVRTFGPGPIQQLLALNGTLTQSEQALTQLDAIADQLIASPVPEAQAQGQQFKEWVALLSTNIGFAKQFAEMLPLLIAGAPQLRFNTLEDAFAYYLDQANEVRATTDLASTIFRVFSDIFPYAAYVSYTLAFLVSISSTVFVLVRFRKTLAVVTRGGGPLLPNWTPRDFLASKSPLLLGFQFSTAAGGYYVFSVVIFVSLVAIGNPYTWQFVKTPAVTAILVNLLVAFAVRRVLFDYLIGRKLMSGEGGMFIRKPKGWTWFSGFLFLYGLLSGIVSAAFRLVFLVLLSLCAILRIDVTIFPKSLSDWDDGYTSFMSLLMTHHRHLNPTMNVAAKMFMQGGRRRAEQRSASQAEGGDGSGGGGSVSSSASPRSLAREAGVEGDVSAGGEPLNMIRLDAGGSAVDSSHRARLRWQLGYTLVMNPRLRHYRKGAIAEYTEEADEFEMADGSGGKDAGAAGLTDEHAALFDARSGAESARTDPWIGGSDYSGPIAPRSTIGSRAARLSRYRGASLVVDPAAGLDGRQRADLDDD